MFDGSPEAKIGHYGKGAERLAGGADDAIRAHLISEQAALFVQLRRFGEARDAATTALGLAQRVEAEGTICNARGNLAVALMNLGEPKRALEILEGLAQLQERRVDLRGLETTRSNIAACRMRMGDLTEASFDTSGNDLENIFNEAQRLALLGRLDEAFPLYERATTLALDAPQPAVSPAAIVAQHARALMSAGRAAESINAMEEAYDLAKAVGDRGAASEAESWLEEVFRILASRAPG